MSAQAKHHFHMVNPSPWPALGAFAGLMTAIGAVLYFHKAPVFGILIGVTGCYEGMQVRQNAEEVGRRTTSAVVAAIFLVIVLDAFFAVFFSTLGWN